MNFEWRKNTELLYKKYRMNSIFFQNLKLIVVVLLLPILLLLFLLFRLYFAVEEKELKEAYSTTAEKMREDLDSLLNVAETQVTHIAFDQEVERCAMGEGAREEDIEHIRELLKVPSMAQNGIHSIYFYVPGNGSVFTGDGMFDYDLFYDRENLESYYSGEKPLGKSFVSVRIPGTDRRFLALYQEIHYSEEKTGLIIVNMELERFLTAGTGETVCIADHDRVLYSTEKTLEGRALSDFSAYKKAEDGIYVGEDECVVSVSLRAEPLQVVLYSDNSGLHQKITVLRAALTGTVILLVLLLLAACIGVSVRVFRPIHTIIQEIESNGLSMLPEEQDRSSNEIGLIVNSIKQTKKNYQNIERILAERTRLLKKLQSIALQSQINPHFMNNTLETINWMALETIGADNEISRMICSLSKMLRMSLEDTDMIIPIAKEMEHAWHYVQIQQIRYEGMFEMDWQIGEELLPCKTIKIVLQPLIENAIYHGIKKNGRKGKIIVGGRREEGLIRLWVKDNGIGIPPEEMENLSRELKSKEIKEGCHIGIVNVNQRLKLYFGEEYGIQVHSHLGEGSTFELIFPVTDRDFFIQKKQQIRGTF